MTQEWVCEVCGMSGAVEVHNDFDVMSVVYAIEDAHDRLAHEFARHCRFDVHKVRVRSQTTDIYAWNRFVASLERKLNRGVPLMTLAQIERLKQLRSKRDLEQVGSVLVEALKKLQKQAEKKREDAA